MYESSWGSARPECRSVYRRGTINGFARHLMLASFCLGTVLAGAAAAEVATVASGFTTPATLTFRQGPTTLADDFNAATLNNCRWEQDSGGGYTTQLNGSALVVSGSGSGNNSLAGIALQTTDNFSASSYSAQMVISAATAAQYRVSLTAKDSNDGNNGSFDASVQRQSDGNFHLSVSYGAGSSSIAFDGGAVFSGAHAEPLPFTLTLTVDSNAGTVSAGFQSAAGNSTRTISATSPFSTLRIRAQLANFDSGSVSLDSFSSNLTQGTKYTLSTSPLSVFGTDYSDVPFTSPPTIGAVFIAGNPLLVTGQDACVPLDGTVDISSALATFGPFHVSIFTTQSQSAIEGLVQSNGGSLNCFGSGFTNNGADNDYTFAPPDCPAPSSDTPTATVPAATPTATVPAPTATATVPAPTATATAPLPTATATVPLPTATSTSPPASTPTATATVPPADLEIVSAVLSRGRDRSPRDNGTVSVNAQIADEGQLVDRVVAGGFSLEVEDGDGSFHVILPLSGCRKLSNGNASCSSATGTARLGANGPGRWKLRLRADHLPNSVTGPTGGTTNPTEGPVVVTLHEGVTQTVASILSCRQSGLTKLTCRQ